MISFDAAVDHGWTSASVVTKSATVGSGSDRVLFVHIFSNVSSDVVASVTYNGMAMTRLTRLSPQSNAQHYVYVLANPPTGSNNIVVTNSSSALTRVLHSSYDGVDATNFPDDSSGGTSSSGSSLSGTVTTTVDNCWLIASGVGMSGVTAGTGFTERAGGSGLQNIVGDSNGAKSPAGIYGMTIGLNGNDNGSLFIISIAPAGAAPPVTPKSGFFNLL